jgi:hypothetical protein
MIYHRVVPYDEEQHFWQAKWGGPHQSNLKARIASELVPILYRQWNVPRQGACVSSPQPNNNKATINVAFVRQYIIAYQNSTSSDGLSSRCFSVLRYQKRLAKLKWISRTKYWRFEASLGRRISRHGLMDATNHKDLGFLVAFNKRLGLLSRAHVTARDEVV